MTTCAHGDNCARPEGHLGACTPWPHPSTWDFDRNHAETTERHIEAAVTLLALDFATPAWADLLDDQ